MSRCNFWCGMDRTQAQNLKQTGSQAFTKFTPQTGTCISQIRNRAMQINSVACPVHSYPRSSIFYKCMHEIEHSPGPGTIPLCLLPSTSKKKKNAKYKLQSDLGKKKKTPFELSSILLIPLLSKCVAVLYADCAIQ